MGISGKAFNPMLIARKQSCELMSYKLSDRGDNNKGKLEGLKVLVIEDDIVNITVMKWLLAETGVKNITFANSANEALSHLQNHFDLIFLDISLPDLNGIELCKKIRTLPNLKDIPIIAVTSFDDDAKELCISAGMNGFIKKPIDINFLKDVIDKLI